MKTAPAPTAANPNDAVRDAILRFLYDKSQSASSPTTACVLVSEIQKAMKADHGIKRNRVGGNLDYLIQKGWVVEVLEQREVQTGRTRRINERRTYKISDTGIDLMQHPSLYRREEKAASYVNIGNVSGVAVVGDGNVVSQQYAALPQKLADFREAVQDEPKLTDEQRLEVLTGLNTMLSHVQSPHPDPTVLTTLWGLVQKAVTAGGAAHLVTEYGPGIAALIGG